MDLRKPIELGGGGGGGVACCRLESVCQRLWNVLLLLQLLQFFGDLPLCCTGQILRNLSIYRVFKQVLDLLVLWLVHYHSVTPLVCCQDHKVWSFSQASHCCSFWSSHIGGGWLGFLQDLHTLPLRSFASLLSNLLGTLPTLAIISSYGILCGAGAKFRPWRRTSSVLDSSWEDKFTTHLLWSTQYSCSSWAVWWQSIRRSIFLICFCLASTKVFSAALSHICEILLKSFSVIFCSRSALFFWILLCSWIFL